MKAPREEHLRDEDFFLLVLPPAGAPEALPGHLSGCSRCARQLSEWRAAVERLAPAPAGAPAEFEERVMATIRAERTPRRTTGPRSLGRWAGRISVAAALLAAFWLGTRVSRVPESPLPVRVNVLSPTDRADDELLKDVSRLVSSENVDREDESGWKSVAPLPPVPGGNS
jgi:hypothetical protein